MTFSTTSESIALATNNESTEKTRQGILPSSRGTGGAVPDNRHNAAPVTKQEVKPWTHFVAGGYVALSHPKVDRSYQKPNLIVLDLAV